MDTLMEQHRLATGIYQKTLDNWNKIIFIISKSLLVMYMGAVLIFLLIPLAFYVFEGKLQLAIEIVLPFVNPTTERGFYVSLIFQVYSLIFACAGISSIDGMFVLYSFQGLALVQTTRMSFQEFGQRLETGNGMPEHPLVLKSQLRQVLQRYILMQKWIHIAFHVDPWIGYHLFLFSLFRRSVELQLLGWRCNVLFDGFIGSCGRYITEYGSVSIHIDCGKSHEAAVTLFHLTQ